MLRPDPKIREQDTWQDFSEKGLCPEIQNLEAYRGRLTKNYIRFGLGEGPKLKNFKLDPEMLQATHRTLFGGIYPFAGRLRETQVFCRGRAGADPKNIRVELETLETQVGIMLQEAKHPRAIARIAAFQHARLTTIQAFADGNSRTSRAITERFLSAVFQKNRQKEINRSDYLKALESALGEENLAPLTNLFLEIYGQAPEKTKWIPSPFRTTNLPGNPDTLRALGQSFRQPPSVLDEQAPRKTQFLRNFSWDEISKSVGGKGTKSEPACKQLWEEAQTKTMSWEETESFLQKIQALHPFTKPLLGKAPKWEGLAQTIRPKELGRTYGSGEMMVR